MGKACYLVTCNAQIMITINQYSLLCKGGLDRVTQWVMRSNLVPWYYFTEYLGQGAGKQGLKGV